MGAHPPLAIFGTVAAKKTATITQKSAGRALRCARSSRSVTVHRKVAATATPYAEESASELRKTSTTPSTPTARAQLTAGR